MFYALIMAFICGVLYEIYQKSIRKWWKDNVENTFFDEFGDKIKNITFMGALIVVGFCIAMILGFKDGFSVFVSTVFLEAAGFWGGIKVTQKWFKPNMKQMEE